MLHWGRDEEEKKKGRNTQWNKANYNEQSRNGFYVYSLVLHPGSNLSPKERKKRASVYRWWQWKQHILHMCKGLFIYFLTCSPPKKKNETLAFVLLPPTRLISRNVVFFGLSKIMLRASFLNTHLSFFFLHSREIKSAVLFDYPLPPLTTRLKKRSKTWQIELQYHLPCHGELYVLENKVASVSRSCLLASDCALSINLAPPGMMLNYGL